MRRNKELVAFFNAQEKELNKLAIQAMGQNSLLDNNRVSLYVQILRFAQKIASELANSFRR